MPSIRVISPGVLSLVQDNGRWGFQRFGVSVSGAMDHDSLLLGNRLVGNELESAAVEVTFGGAEYAFDEDALIAITGADLSATSRRSNSPRPPRPETNCRSAPLRMNESTCTCPWTSYL